VDVGVSSFTLFQFSSFLYFSREILDSIRSIKGNSNFKPAVSSDIVDQTKVPGDLQCPICKKLFKDAVVTPCCGVSYCDECRWCLFF